MALSTINLKIKSNEQIAIVGKMDLGKALYLKFYVGYINLLVGSYLLIILIWRILM